MVLIYENDPLDNEDARGRFYHVCRGKIDRTEIQLPAGESVYECPGAESISKQKIFGSRDRKDRCRNGWKRRTKDRSGHARADDAVRHLLRPGHRR